MRSGIYRSVFALASFALLAALPGESRATDYYIRPYSGSYFRNLNTGIGSPYAPYPYSNLRIVNIRSAYGPNNTYPAGDYNAAMAQRRNNFANPLIGFNYGFLQQSAGSNSNSYYYSPSPPIGNSTQSSYYYTPPVSYSSATSGGSAYFSAIGQ